MDVPGKIAKLNGSIQGKRDVLSKEQARTDQLQAEVENLAQDLNRLLSSTPKQDVSSAKQAAVNITGAMKYSLGYVWREFIRIFINIMIPLN